MNYIKLIVLFVTLLFFRCSEKPTDLGGGASGNGNAIISGKVLKSNGTPAINANILLVPVSIDPTASNGNPTVISAKTDGAGIYSINTPLSGNWNAFANDGLGNVAFNDSLALTGDSTVLPPLLLKSKGKLQIVFKTQPQHDPRLIDVIFWGTNRVLVPVSRDGLMIVDDLAEGTYPVRIKLSTEYAVIDTHFTIRAGETSGKDTITLPYLSIPVVTGLKAEYDTLNGKVYISWNGIDTTKITGYNIYRSSVDSNSSNVLINTVPVVKTTFVDSFSVFGSTYLYRIKAIGKNGDLCPIYSASASVNAVNRLMVTTVIELRTFNTKNDTASINDIVGF
ncbi:MAG: hypothetical protein JNL74_07430, partial [Fibrobacteres bacterium]|nr:hypothetical protein [Fibrobacterota bacterium]